MKDGFGRMGGGFFVYVWQGQRAQVTDDPPWSRFQFWGHKRVSGTRHLFFHLNSHAFLNLFMLVTLTSDDHAHSLHLSLLAPLYHPRTMECTINLHFEQTDPPPPSLSLSDEHTHAQFCKQNIECTAQLTLLSNCPKTPVLSPSLFLPLPLSLG